MSPVRALRAIFGGKGVPVAAVTPPHDRDYEAPVLVDLGEVRDVVLGNSSSGNGDANSQYYW
ncbi:MAG: lasso RiPP family leader peptide-containing protein [Saccharothrix sp.]|nr:lasso RiPP family leader peptide-containing protein [Saccharothrix sp.]